MSRLCYEGRIAIKASELNLDLTLLGGQSFRWEKVVEPTVQCTEWRGVAFNSYWVLTQNPDTVAYRVYPAPKVTPGSESTVPRRTADYFQNLLQRYLRAEFDLPAHVKTWKAAHEHFAQIAPHMKAVRVLNQEPLENLLSFMCSQNNNIKRISSMINWLCVNYGICIGHLDKQDRYTFPTLAALAAKQQQLESSLRSAKFGYRAKFIAQTVAQIASAGGEAWLEQLRQLPYSEARLALTNLPGVGFKVADCICLMSLNHLEAVPVDTHIYKIVQTAYMPHLAQVKSVTPKVYDDISKYFRSIYGDYAGWAQAVLFCADLQQFQTKGEHQSKPVAKRKQKRKHE